MAQVPTKSGTGSPLPRARKLVPVITTNSHQDTAAAYPRVPRLQEAYVALPGHPFYGQLVQVLQYYRKGATLSCLITAPGNPNLHYRLPARWLEADTPPSAVPPAQVPTSIALSLAALDTLTQRVRALCLLESADAPSHTLPHPVPPDLGATSPTAGQPPEYPPIPPGPAAHERSGQ